MSTQICPSCLSQKFDHGRCMNCGFSRAEYRPAPTALPLDTMIGKYRIGVMKATSRQSQIYTGIDVASSAPVLIEEFFPAKMVGRMTDGLRVLPAQSDPQSQQRFQQACRMIEMSTQNRPLRKAAVIRANNTIYNVFEPMMNVPADAQCEALADNPVYFRGPDDKPLMTINMLPIPPMPRERAYDPTGTAAKDVLVRTQMDTSTVKEQADLKPIKLKKKSKLPIILSAAGVAVIALVCVLVILLTKKTPDSNPTIAVVTTTPADHTVSNDASNELGEFHIEGGAEDKDQVATATDQETNKQVITPKDNTKSDDDTATEKEKSNGSSDEENDEEDTYKAKNGKGDDAEPTNKEDDADSEKDDEKSSEAEEDSKKPADTKDGEEESDQPEDSNKAPNADDKEPSDDTQNTQLDEHVSSELSSLKSIADKLRVEVKESTTVYLKNTDRNELDAGRVYRVMCVTDGKKENVFSASGKNGYDINVKVDSGESARLRIYTMSRGKASPIDTVQVMMIVWEDVGRLKKGEYITVGNIEDWARIQEKFLEKKDVCLRLIDTGNQYYLRVTYTEGKKKEPTQIDYKIKTVPLNGTDQSSGTQQVPDHQDSDNHAGTSSPFVDKGTD